MNHLPDCGNSKNVRNVGEIISSPWEPDISQIQLSLSDQIINNKSQTIALFMCEVCIDGNRASKIIKMSINKGIGK